MLLPHSRVVKKAKSARQPLRRFIPMLEALEGREAPAVINVNSTADQLLNPTTVTVNTLGSTVSLRDAINAANNTGGSNTIALQGNTYSLNVVDNFWFGPNAFPAISSIITIEGNGATLSRASGSPNFRFFFVSGGPSYSTLLNAGTLTLENLTLSGGLEQGGNSNGGGAGLGAGGAIFNMGTLNVVNSTLSGNLAQGGKGGVSDLGKGGAGIGQNAPSNNNGGGFGGTGSYGGGTGGTGGQSTGGANGGGGGGFTANGRTAALIKAGNGGGSSGLGGNGYGISYGGSYGGDGGGGSVGILSPSGGNGGNFGQGGGSGGSQGGGGGGGVGGGGGYGNGGGGGGFGGGGAAATAGIRGGNGGFGGGSGIFSGQGLGAGFGGGAGLYGSGGAGAGLGGAIFNLYGMVTITNSTLANNSATGGGGLGHPGSGYGGAVFNLNGTVSLLNATLANNTVVGGNGLQAAPTSQGSGTAPSTGASDGGAVYNLSYGATPSGGSVSATLNLANSILAGSSGGSDLASSQLAGTTSIVAIGPNLVQTPGSGASSPSGTAFTVAAPSLGPLQNNGGLTFTMAELTGSPTIGAGSTAPSPTITNTFTTSVGDPVVSQPNVDTDVGQVYINQQTFSGQFEPSSISFYVASQSVGHVITPLVFSVNGGTYTLAAAYNSVLAAQAGVNTALTQLQGGSLVSGTTYVFGYTDQDQNPKVAATTGTIPFNTASPGDWLYTGGATGGRAVALTLGSTFATTSGAANFTLFSGRVYSAMMSLSDTVSWPTSLPTYDQRGPGFARVVNGVVDLGAFQVQSSTIAVADPDTRQPSLVRLFDPVTLALKGELKPYGDFTGDVRVAFGDLDGDGLPELICGAGPGGGPNVVVLSGKSGSLVNSFMAFDPSFTGGVFVAGGDINRDGQADIIVGADAGGGPNVVVFDGRSVLTGTSHPVQFLNFMAFDVRFTGGVRVAAGDVNGDGRADIIVGAGTGGGPNVEIFLGPNGALLTSFFALDENFTGGVFVAAGDMDGDGRAELIAGAGDGGGPNVTVFRINGSRISLLLSFMAYDPNFTGGVRVAGMNDRGRREVLTAPGPGGGADIRRFDGATGAAIDRFFAFDPLLTSGYFVAST